MSDEIPAPLIWVDIETSGLDPAVDWLMEVGAIATDGDLFQIGEEFQCVININDFKIGNFTPLVLDMHSQNGLLVECRTEGVDVGTCSDRFQNWLKDIMVDQGLDYPPKFLMAGASVHFDRSWLNVHFGAAMLDKYFTYRLLDVSVFKECIKRWFPNDDELPDELKDMTELESAHRAIPDLRAAITHLKFYKEMMGA